MRSNLCRAPYPAPARGMDSEESDKYRAPALDKGLDILELLASVEIGRASCRERV